MKKTMKKSLAFTLLLSLTLSGCGSSDSKTPNNENDDQNIDNPSDSNTGDDLETDSEIDTDVEDNDDQNIDNPIDSNTDTELETDNDTNTDIGTGIETKKASITDTSETAAGSLTYKIKDDTGATQELTAGSASIDVLYPEGEDNDFSIAIYDSSGKTNTTIADVILKSDGRIQLRDTQKVSGSDKITLEITHTPGEWLNVQLTWNKSSNTYRLKLNNVLIGDYEFNNLDAVGVSSFGLKLASKEKTSTLATKIDNLAIYSDTVMETLIFADTFESYVLDELLDGEGDPYNGTSAIISGPTLIIDTDTDTETNTDTDTETNTDTDTETDANSDTDEDTIGKGAGYDNPWVGGNYYVNPEWSENASAEPGGEAIAHYNTGVWMDQIAAIEGTSGMGLRDHLNEAVLQGVDVFMVVVYDLPNRDCAALASSGELRISEDGFNRYKNDYIAPFAEILSDPAYKDLRIVTIVEVDSLPNLVTNLDIADCEEANGPGGYRDGIAHTLNIFSKIPNVYSYVDISHSGWLGWTENFEKSTTLIAEVIESTDNGWDSIAGFASNASNYTPVEEPYLPDPTLEVGGYPIRSADFYEWTNYFEEKDFVQDWRETMIAKGAPETLGMLIDTARNGWGGDNRPNRPSKSTDLNTYVNESKIDQRAHRGNWCNQPGGVGFKPYADPYEGIDAFVWIKPQGESDGVSDPNFEIDPNDPAKKHDPMCDPEAFNTSNPILTTGAMANAPHAGRWFSEGFQLLLANAYPPADEPAGQPEEVPLPTDCDGYDPDNPLFVTNGISATVEFTCGPIYVEFAETTKAIEFDNTGSEMAATITYNGLTDVISGYYQSKNIATTTMKITKNEGGANSLLISYH